MSYTQLPLQHTVNMELSYILTYAEDLKTLLSAYDNSIQQLTMLGGYYADFSTTLFIKSKQKIHVWQSDFLNIIDVYIQVKIKRL